MKSLKYLLVVILLLSSITFSGCTKGCSKKFKHIKSSTIGLNRRVVLYAYNGIPIKTWEGRFMVELNGSAAAFIVDGKEVKIAGTFVIEEL